MESDRYESLKQRHEAACSKLQFITNYQNSRDLYRLIRSCDNLNSDLSKERVECRRLKRETVKYREFLDHYEQAVTVLEEYVTYALLID